MEGQKFNVTIWTSCHGDEHHFLPQVIEGIFADNEYITEPHLNAVPGRFMTHELVAEIREHLGRLTKPHINVLMLGESNVQTFAIKGAFKYFKYTKEIIELHRGTKHGLLVCGLLPCPKLYAQVTALSNFVDNKLHKAVQNLHETEGISAANIGFVPLEGHFRDKDGFLLSRMYFEDDEIHLNETGVLKLAPTLLDYICDLASSIVNAAN